MDIVDCIAVSIMQGLFISIHNTIQAINCFFSLILILITLIATQTGANTMVLQPINGSFAEQLCIHIMCITLKTINDTMKIDRCRLIPTQIALIFNIFEDGNVALVLVFTSPNMHDTLKICQGSRNCINYKDINEMLGN